MNKAELDLLEKIFSAEITGALFATNSKLAKKLEADGLILYEERVVGKDNFGPIIAKGYNLTFQGNFVYCTSDRCAGEFPDGLPSDTIILRCPVCQKEKEVEREDDDPIKARVMQTACDSCEKESVPDIQYFDAEGNLI